MQLQDVIYKEFIAFPGQNFILVVKFTNVTNNFLCMTQYREKSITSCGNVLPHVKILSNFDLHRNTARLCYKTASTCCGSLMPYKN